ncbi:uncharacterized protein LOC128715157 [Anopheles marshallii]|uniref:uncharacterized protein LOC128715157 n=1 Tax=Anopheles marshallii TaxID=1521116 RepID=UPI00237A18DF|nr:uncharacterized protein LOC128715157 [Anopheles marshallii]
MKRYLLDLSELFTDHRQKAYIGYRAAWTTVECVIRTIRNTFNIQSGIYICSEDGIFYPANESVELICEEKSIKVLPSEKVRKEKIISDDEPPNWRIAKTKQESNTYEDIESVLSSLPTPKRHRVRKRKVKQVAREESPPRMKQRVQQTATVTRQNGHIRFPLEESHSSDGSKVTYEPERPYRNLNREMKARVVRAVSPSALIKQRSEPPTAMVTNEAADTREPIKCISKPNIKPKVVRAIPCTVEVKQEQLNASAMETNVAMGQETLQQSYQPQTVEDSNVIAIDSPTPVNGQEATHDTAVPAV